MVKSNFLSKSNIPPIALFAAVFLYVGILFYSNRVPTIIVTEPTDGITTQAKEISIKGYIKPKGAILSINDIPVKTESGVINYSAQLKYEKNVFILKATNSDNKSQMQITINRTFTKEELTELQRQKAEAEAAKVKAQAEELKKKLTKEIEGIKKFDGSLYRGSIGWLTLEADAFFAYANLIKQYRYNPDQDVKSLVEELQNELVKLQTKEFPLIRENYVEVVAESLWEENGKARCYGSGNKNLVVISSLFAYNKNIAELHSSIEPTLNLLRFDRVDYKWIDYDTEYSYYTLDGTKDSAVIGDRKKRSPID